MSLSIFWLNPAALAMRTLQVGLRLRVTRPGNLMARRAGHVTKAGVPHTRPSQQVPAPVVAH